MRGDLRYLSEAGEYPQLVMESCRRILLLTVISQGDPIGTAAVPMSPIDHWKRGLKIDEIWVD